MSKHLNSPTARLLQSSRLFSLPRPLPRPEIDQIVTSSNYRGSDTATLPYPTHQAIATTASSQHYGDWGLKRSLPTKGVMSTSNAHIRIIARDTPQQVTDFESAQQHTRTEAKWQEMSIPMTIESSRSTISNDASSRGLRSVYDEQFDNTTVSDRDSIRDQGPLQSNSRWKYKGVHVGGLGENEFQEYLQAKILPRKKEFRKFLINHILTKRLRSAERARRQAGDSDSAVKIDKEQMRQEIEENFPSEERLLREHHIDQQLGSDLTAAICEFLDLPPMSNDLQGMSANSPSIARMMRTVNIRSEAPPSTHPGAGLSFIRSNAYMENHPIYGPQAYRTPVLARVLRTRVHVQGTDNVAKLGVGGVHTRDAINSAGGRERRNLRATEVSPYLDADRMTSQIDAGLEGGNKIWVHPEYANIDSKGRIRLQVSRGDKEAVAVKTGEIDAILEARALSATRGPMRSSIDPSLFDASTSTSKTSRFAPRSFRTASRSAENSLDQMADTSAELKSFRNRSRS